MNDHMPFQNRGDFMFGPAGHHGGTGALAWTIFALQLLLLLGLALLVARAFAGSRLHTWNRAVPAGGPPPPMPAHDPLEVVRMRYARGELDREEYLAAVRDLGGTPADEAPTRET